MILILKNMLTLDIRFSNRRGSLIENIIKKVCSMLELCSTELSKCPPTFLYNEGWMLRLVLDWFATHPTIKHSLYFPENAKWHSEALLPSTFLPRKKVDKFAESWTHADGVIGHFNIGLGSSIGALSLKQNASHFVVMEAKMFSKLSSGVKNASFYNQAARNVACIAETLKKGKRKPSGMSSLGFYLLAPKSQIQKGIFEAYMTHNAIQETVERRVNEYNESKDEWLSEWFIPTIKQIDIGIISWEQLIEFITINDRTTGDEISEFYALCLKFNKK